MDKPVISRPAVVARALVMGKYQMGVSPIQNSHQGSVTESNCLIVRWGGEQLEVKDQSVAKANSFRRVIVSSHRAYDED